MIPFNDIPLVRRLNKRLVEHTLRKVMGDLNGRVPILVTSVPNAADYIDYVPARRIIYYCVDDFSEWPGLDKRLVLQMEAKLIDKADQFVATSPQLVQRLAKTGKPTSLLSHGVDTELFSSIALNEHSVLSEIPAPRIGYFGLFDDRSDQNLIASVADKMPELSIVIAGPIEAQIQHLQSFKNIFFVGPIPYLELPNLVIGLDLLFLPYTVNALTDALSPLKFKEYIATGRPILSTPIAAAEEFDDFVRVASTPEQWCIEIEKLLSEDFSSRRNEAATSLVRESWIEKSKQFLAHCVS